MFYTTLDVVLLNVVFLEDGYSKVVVYYVLYNTKKTTVYGIDCIAWKNSLQIINTGEEGTCFHRELPNVCGWIQIFLDCPLLSHKILKKPIYLTVERRYLTDWIPSRIEGESIGFSMMRVKLELEIIFTNIKLVKLCL